MEKYIDPNGELCEAQQLTGPTILNTITGEVCGIEGQWMIRKLNTGEIAVMEDEQFKLSFVRGE